LIEKRYGHIDKHRRTAQVRPPEAKFKPTVPQRTNQGDQVMQASHLIAVVDRLALTVMNAIVFVGLPLAAVGLFVR
jgi:hypothetical protein